MAEVKNICLEALERHCSSGTTGCLHLQRGPYEGEIFTRDHLIIHARLGGLEGVPALFRLFDWGDAETIWQPEVTTEQPSLHLTMENASVLYGEHLQELSNLETRERERVDQTLNSAELLTGAAGGGSVLKSYTILLECSEKALLPDGFTLTDTAKNSYVIGSSDECDVILRHPTVDPLHCGVILEKGSILIWDLGSNGGVRLNGVAVAQDILKVGDIMTLGAVELHVRFQLRRPSMNRTATSPLPVPTPGALAAPVTPSGPPKELPKGAITYEKVSRQLKDNGKAKPFLQKLGSLFGSKDRK